MCPKNRLVGGTGERNDRHDMESDRNLDSRTDCLQSRQVFTGNLILLFVLALSDNKEENILKKQSTK